MTETKLRKKKIIGARAFRGARRGGAEPSRSLRGGLGCRRRAGALRGLTPRPGPAGGGRGGAGRARGCGAEVRRYAPGRPGPGPASSTRANIAF